MACQRVISGDTPEALLLLASAQLLWDSSKDRQIGALLQNNLDWDFLVEAALFHGILPLLYNAIRNAALTAVPQDVVENLRVRSLQIAARNLVLTRVLTEVLVQLRGKGIQAIPLRGPKLAVDLYGSIALRGCDDLDILVHTMDAVKAREILVARGYSDLDALNPVEEARWLASAGEFHLYDYEREILTEIHWQILPPQAFDPEFPWSRTIKSSIEGTETLTLPAEEMFLLLAIHAGDKHDWTRLKWICDLALLTVKCNINWERLLGLARSYGALRCVLRAVSVVHQVFGIALPEALENACSGRPYRAFSSLVRGRLFHTNAGLPGFREWRYYFAGDKGANATLLKPQMLRLCLHLFDYFRVIAEPRFNDRYGFPLPPFLSFLHYPYRAILLTRRHGWKLCKRLIG